MAQSHPEDLTGIEIGSAQGNPYWSDDDHWSNASAQEAIAILEQIATS